MGMNDKQRLDKLDKLMKRTAYINPKNPQMALSTDIHLRNGGVTIYCRDFDGTVSKSGFGKNIREAIDDLIN